MKRTALIILIMTFTIGSASAQFLEDALRFNKSNGMVTPRVAGLNVAYHGVADDVGAMLYNPAGLSLSGRSEISIGFGFIRNTANTEYLGSELEFSSNTANLSHIALMSPFKMGEKKAAIGIGYFEESNYFNDMKFDAFNQNSTFIDHIAKFGDGDPNNNFATRLGLADSRDFSTPLKDSLQQVGFVQESGGLRNVTGAAAFDISEYFAIGFAIAGKFGNYDYIYELEEIDRENIYNTYDPDELSEIDLQRWYYKENVAQEISGITGSIGLQARIEDFMRVGATIQFPTYLSIDETFSSDARAYFDNGDVAPGAGFEPLYSDGRSAYNITTPFKYSAGFSVNAKGLTFTTGVEYSDATQLEFTDGADDEFGNDNDYEIGSRLDELNSDIINLLTGQTTWGFGLEYKLPGLPFVARASYAGRTSPYGEDVPGANMSFLSVGGGVFIGPNIRIDGVFRWTEVSELRTVYGEQNYVFTQNPLNLGLQLTYRY